MRAHDAASRGDPLVQKLLHDRHLVNPVRQAHAVALPIGTRPFGLQRQKESLDIAQQLLIVGRQNPTTRYQFRQTPELLSSDRRLDIGHAIIVADGEIVLEHDLRRAVPHRVGDAHAVLAEQPKGVIELCI